MALLELSTEGHREPVIIDDVEYLLASFDSFSITDQHQLQKNGKRLADIGKKAGKAGMTDEEAQEMEDISEAMFTRVAGDIPEDIGIKLEAGGRQQVVQAYFLAFAKLQRNRSAVASRNGQATASQRSRGSTQGSRKKSG